MVEARRDEAGPPSHQARLDRANELMTALVSETRIWEDRAHRFPVDDVDPETGRRVVTLEVDEPTPAGWGPIIGDILHNCRSALDHLAYALAVTNCGLPLPEKVETNTEFPIFSTPELFKRRAHRDIGGMSEEAKAVVESLQPYHRGEKWPIDPLWLLHLLSNIDKHRRPAVTTLYIEPNPEADSRFEVGLRGPARHGVPHVIGRYEQQSEVTSQVSWGYAYGVAFDEDLAWKPPYVPHILYTIWAHIGDTIFPQLTPLLH